jgi:hypothetical protein
MPRRRSLHRSRKNRSRRMAYGLAGGDDYHGGAPAFSTSPGSDGVIVTMGGGPAPVTASVGGGADAVAVPGGGNFVAGRSRRHRRRRSSRRH